MKWSAILSKVACPCPSMLAGGYDCKTTYNKKNSNYIIKINKIKVKFMPTKKDSYLVKRRKILKRKTSEQPIIR